MSKNFRYTLIAVAIVIFAACKGGEGKCKKNCGPTEPIPNPTCTVKFDKSSVVHESEGGTFPLGLTKCNCTDVQADVSWISVSLASMTYTLPANTVNESRFGKIKACGAELLVTQKQYIAPSCIYKASPGVNNLTSCEAGEGSFDVSVTDGCPLNINPVSDSPDWLTVLPSCPTCATVHYAYTKNTTGATRTGKIKGANCEHVVVQPPCPAECEYTVAPSTYTFEYNDLQSRTVSTAKSSASCPDCTSIAGVPEWLNVIPAGNGSFQVAPKSVNNSQSERSVTIYFCGKPVFIVQKPAPQTCVYSANPTGQHFPHTGGNGSLTVTAQAGCPACTTVPANVPAWVKNLASNGNGTWSYTTSENNGSYREVTLYFCGASYKISQDREPQQPPQCVLNASNAGTVSYQGGSFSIPVSSNESWTASSSNSYVHFSNSSGNGNGMITGTLDPSNGARTATVTINGCKTITVSIPQSAPPQCTFAVQNTPLSWNWDETSNSGVIVSTQPGCDWSVSSTNQGWVGFPDSPTASGTGPGDFKVSPTSNNTSTTTRNAVVNFIGEGGYTQTIPVSQTGKPATTCTYAVQNTQITFSWNPTDNAGVIVSTQAGCEWKLQPTATWVYTDRPGGTGPGDFKIGAAGNGGGERNAKVRVTTGDGALITEIPVKQTAKP